MVLVRFRVSVRWKSVLDDFCMNWFGTLFSATVTKRIHMFSIFANPDAKLFERSCVQRAVQDYLCLMDCQEAGPVVVKAFKVVHSSCQNISIKSV